MENYKRIGWGELGVINLAVCYDADNSTELRWGVRCPTSRCTRSILLAQTVLDLFTARNEVGELGWMEHKKRWYCPSCNSTHVATQERHTKGKK